MENIKKMFENIGRIYLYTEKCKGRCKWCKTNIQWKPTQDWKTEKP